MKKFFLFFFISIFMFTAQSNQRDLITQEMKNFGIKQKSIDLYWKTKEFTVPDKEYEKTLNKAIEADPRNYFALDDMGVHYRRSNNPDKAIEYYKKSIAVNPNNPFPYFNAGVAYMYKKDFVNAERIYKQLITAIPDYPEGYYGLGQVYLNMENYAKALEFIQKAKEKYKNLDTKKYFEEAAKKDMYIADCNYLEGQINYRMKDYQKAVDGFFDSFEDMKAIRYYALSDFATLAYFANEGLKGTNPKQYDKNIKKFEAAGIKMKR